MFGWFRREPTHVEERRHQMLDAVADYPVYQPPHRQGPNHPNRLRIKGDEKYIHSFRDFLARGRENFEYFLENRETRLAALQAFLAKFDVKMSRDDAGLAAVSAWCPDNCGVLASKFRDNATRQAFFQMLEPWTGSRRGFNVIFDLGVFLGEAVIARNHHLSWDYRPGASDDGSATLSGYQIIGFANKRDWFDPPQRMYGICLNAEDDLRIERGGRFVREDTLVGAVRDFSTR
jgi:hypothetical protein